MTIDECVREIIANELYRYNLLDSLGGINANKCDIYELQEKCAHLEDQIDSISRIENDLNIVKNQGDERAVVLNNQIFLIEADLVKLQAELRHLRSALDALTEKPKQKSLLEIFEENTQFNLKEYLDNNPFLNN